MSKRGSKGEAKTIAIGGLQHETNTFAPVPALYEDFVKADGWPPMGRGEEMFGNIDGIHLPITGAYDFLRKQEGVNCLPLLWASAVPSAQVSEHAFETIAAMFIEDLAAAKQQIDGVYLDLHGAMVCDHLEDGEGELLKRIREVIGDMPLTISLDLHANITPEMVALCDYIDIFRTYPHIDMAETGERAAQVLLELLEGAPAPAKAFRQGDFIIPLCDGCTFFGASQKFYNEDLNEALKSDIRASAACGFPLADIHHIGPSVLAYAETQAAADAAADKLIGRMSERFSGNTETYWQPDEAVRQAQKALKEHGKPIVIADVQDNPGGGGSGDTTGMLRALLASSVKNAVLACVYDPETAAQLTNHKIGDKVQIALGGKKFGGDTPYECEAEIVALTDGVFTGTGPMWKGARMRLGPMAVVAIGQVRVVVQSQNQQAADCAILRHVGIEPTEEDLLVLKSSVHYRADFQPIAQKIISAKAPGAVHADISDLPYRNIRKSVRRTP